MIRLAAAALPGSWPGDGADDVDGAIEVLDDGVLIRVMDEMAGTSDACMVILDDTWRVRRMIPFVETYV